MSISTESDAARQRFIEASKRSLRDAQRARTWEQRVAAIARMNAAKKVGSGMFHRLAAK